MDSNQPAENRWNQIDRYVNGQMVDDELRTFEGRMREHAELAQQVHLHRDILEGMEFYFMQQLKEELALSDQVKKKFNVRFALQIAASVLLIAGLAGVAYYYLLRPADPQQIFLSYFDTYPNALTQTNRSDSSPDVISEQATAMQYYESGDFSQAATAFTGLLASDSINENRTALMFYRGISYLGANQATEATDDLNTVAQNADSLLAEPATWYLGLSYLRAGQVAEAQKVFIRLRDAGGDYADQAARLLDDLGT